jgi:hypothetical protein
MKLVKEYLHISKDTAYGRDLPVPEVEKLITALYEVEFLVDVDTGTIFAVNGKILSTGEDYEGPEVPLTDDAWRACHRRKWGGEWKPSHSVEVLRRRAEELDSKVNSAVRHLRGKGRNPYRDEGVQRLREATQSLRRACVALEDATEFLAEEEIRVTECDE